MRSRRQGPPKTYPSWESAASAGGHYDDALVNQFRAARAALNRERGFVPDLTTDPLWTVLSFCPGPISVTDFGGATGETGIALTGLFPSLSYTVVENPTLVALMPRLDRVAFVTQIPAACDIFYSSGTLQCIPNPYEMLEIGFKSASRAVILARNYLLSDTEIFTVHTSPLHANGQGHLPDFPDRQISYPNRTVQEARMLEIARAAGFTLTYRGVHGQFVFLKI